MDRSPAPIASEAYDPERTVVVRRSTGNPRPSRTRRPLTRGVVSFRSISSPHTERGTCQSPSDGGN
jgi:hypothetical protein